jgi:hypothetical protein
MNSLYMSLKASISEAAAASMGAVSRSVRSISSEAGPGIFFLSTWSFWGYFGDILGIFWGYIHFFRQIQMICPIVQARWGKFGHLKQQTWGFLQPTLGILLSRKTIRSGSFLDTPYIFNVCGSFFWGEHAVSASVFDEFPGGKPTEIQ